MRKACNLDHNIDLSVEESREHPFESSLNLGKATAMFTLVAGHVAFLIP